MRFDLWLFNAIHDLAGRSRFADWAAFFFADVLAYIMALGFIAFALSQPVVRRKLFVLLEMLLAFILGRGLLTTLIAAAFGRARPFAALEFESLFVPVTEYSFPSGHMAGLFAISFVLL